MNYHNYRRAPDSKVSDWLFKSIKNLTPAQKQKILEGEIIRLAPFEFYEKRPKIQNFFVRLSILVYPIVWVLIVISLIFNFFITGRWGYKYEKIKWFDNWRHNLGL